MGVQVPPRAPEQWGPVFRGGALTHSGDNSLHRVSVDFDIIEQMFEHDSMAGAITLHPTANLRREQLNSLRQKIQAMQSPVLDQPVYPAKAAIRSLFPGGGLRRGSIYQISPHHSLLWLLIAEATRHGYYVALVGVAHLGFHSAAELGVDLERVVIVQPGQDWWTATSAMADAVSLLVVSPTGPLPSTGQRERLQARLRERGSTLLSRATWPGSDGLIEVTRSVWKGLGHGHGYLTDHLLDLSYRGRRDGAQRQLSLDISAQGVTRVPEAELTTLRPPIASVSQNVFQRYAG